MGLGGLQEEFGRLFAVQLLDPALAAVGGLENDAALAGDPADLRRAETHIGQGDGDRHHSLAPSDSIVVGKQDNAPFADGDDTLPGSGNGENQRIDRSLALQRRALEDIGFGTCRQDPKPHPKCQTANDRPALPNSEHLFT